MARKSRQLGVHHPSLQNGFTVAHYLFSKGLHYDFDEVLVLLSEIDAHNPFVKFVRFLVQAVQMKSRECYEKIGTGYKKFLETDSFFGDMYEAYGMKYFNTQKKGAISIL